MRVYFIRHGESATNKAGVFTGHTDAPLTEQGYKDAEKAGEKLQGIEFDKIYSSDLKRALETAHTAIPGCEPILDRRIREVDVGRLAGKSPSDLTKLLPDFEANRKMLNFAPYGGENADMFLGRVASFMQDLEKLEGIGNVAVFAHGGVIRSVFRYVFALPMERATLTTDNGGVTVFEYAGGKWKLLKHNI